MCLLAFNRPPESARRADTLVVLSVIDNLVKGASGQAVQNIRFMFCTAWPEAPLTRLSITESTTKVSARRALSGGRLNARRHMFAARTQSGMGGAPAGTTPTKEIGR